MFWKKKADKPHIRALQYDLQLIINIDSSMTDKEIEQRIKNNLKALVSSKKYDLKVVQAVRDGEGIIQGLTIQLFIPSKWDLIREGFISDTL
jgi:hypothetical protein